MLDEIPRSNRAITALRLVAIPVHAGPHGVTVTAVGRWEEDLESVMVATADGLRVETSAKTGFRWTHDGWIASDLRLEDSATRVITAALLDQMPPEQGQEIARAHAESSTQEGRRLGSQVMQRSVWQTRPVDVDGESFALFVTNVEQTTAAVADIGPSRVTIYGPQIPTDLALRLVPVSELLIAATD